MVLPTTGPLSFTAIVGEFGGTVPHSLSEYYDKATGIPVSGTISFSDFRGKSNNPLPPTWFTGTTLTSQPINQSFSRNLLATSDSPIIAYAITSSPGFGTLSGLLTDKSVNLTGVQSSMGTFSWTITATDTENQSTPRTFSMTFTSTAPTWNTGTNLGSVNVSTSFSYTLVATSDSPITSYSISSYPSPSFGSLSSMSPSNTVTLSGTSPSTAGTYSWTIVATDTEGQSTSRVFSLTVNNPYIAASWSDYPDPFTIAFAYDRGSYVYAQFSARGFPTPTYRGFIFSPLVESLSVSSSGLLSGYIPYSASGGYYSLYIEASNQLPGNGFPSLDILEVRIFVNY